MNWKVYVGHQHIDSVCVGKKIASVKYVHYSQEKRSRRHVEEPKFHAMPEPKFKQIAACRERGTTVIASKR